VSLSLPSVRALASGWLPSASAGAAALTAFAGKATLRPRDRLRIGIAPERIVLSARRGALKPRLVRAESLAVEPRPGAPRWRAAMDALPALLAQPGATVGSTTVVVSNQLVRYALLPWSAALKNEEEWMAYARHRVLAVHGGASEEWELRVCETAPQGARIVCAMDRAFLDALQDAIAAKGGTLGSVQPYLMAVFNRAGLDRDASTWLVVEEPGRLTLALIQDGVWRSVRARRVDGNWRRDLAGILERESAALGLEQPCDVVAIHSETELDMAAGSALRLRDLVLPADERALAMVLA
jgi:hypothetical protein